MPSVRSRATGGAADQIVDGTTGFLIDLLDVEQVAETMYAAAGRRDVCEAASLHVLGRFTLDRMAEQHAEMIYREVLDGG